MEESRIPHKAYLSLVHLDEKGKKNWASNVRLCLFEYGFGHAWINQGVGNTKTFYVNSDKDSLTAAGRSGMTICKIVTDSVHTLYSIMCLILPKHI